MSDVLDPQEWSLLHFIILFGFFGFLIYYFRMDRQRFIEQEIVGAIQRLADDLFILIDAKDRVKSINPQVEALSGFTATEICGKKWADLPFLREAFGEHFNKQNKMEYEMQFQSHFFSREGKKHVVKWAVMDFSQASSRKMPEEKFGLKVISGSDITALLAHQEAMRRMVADMDQKLAEERDQIASELHYQVNNSLIFFNGQIDLLKSEVEASEQAIFLEKLSEKISETLIHARRISNMISRSQRELRHLGLKTTLEVLAKNFEANYGISINYESDYKASVFPPEIEMFLWESTKELLLNVCKYANADKVRICFKKHAEIYRLVVEDNGVGCAPEAAEAIPGPGGGFGLFRIRNRLPLYEGQFYLTKPESHNGCRAVIEIPLKRRSI